MSRRGQSNIQIPIQGEDQSQGQPSETPTPNPSPNPNPKNCGFRLVLSKYRYRGSEDARDVREVLLIVSALIAAVTFQAGVNPPGGVWQDTVSGHVAGRAIYASHDRAFYVFLLFNTMALSASVSTILSLTYMFPFSLEIWIAMVSMIITYGSSVFAITPHEQVRFRYILCAAAVPWIVRAAVELIRYVVHRFQGPGEPTR